MIFEISGHFVLELKWLLFGGFCKKLEDYKTSEVRFCNLSRVKRLFSFQNLFFSPPPAKLGFFTKTPSFLKIIRQPDFSQKLRFFSKLIQKPDFSRKYKKIRVFSTRVFLPGFFYRVFLPGFSLTRVFSNPGFFYRVFSKMNF